MARVNLTTKRWDEQAGKLIETNDELAIGGKVPDSAGHWEETDDSVLEPAFDQPVSVESLNNRVCVTSYPGDDLGEQINNARADLDVDTENLGNDYLEDVYLYAEPGAYRIETPANLTTLLGSVVDLRGCRITLATDGQPAFDLAESWDYCFIASRLYGDPTAPPSSGLLVTNTDTQGAQENEDSQTGGPERKWHHIQAMWGHYDYAPIYLQGRERSHIVGNFANDASQGYAAAITSNNKVDIGGSYESETSPYQGDLPSGISAKNTWVNRSSFLSIQNSGDGIVYLEGEVDGTSFRDVEAFGKDERSIFVLDTAEETMRSLTYSNVDMRVDSDAYDDTAGACRGFRVQGSNPVYSVTLNGGNANLIDNGGSPLPFIESDVLLRDWVEEGSNNYILPNSDPLVAPTIKNCRFRRIGVGDVEVETSLQLHSNDYEDGVGPLTVKDGADLVCEAKEAARINGDGSTHSIQMASTGTGVHLENLKVSATGSGNDAINTASGTVGNKPVFSDIRVTGSDRDALRLADVREAVVIGCTVEGFDTSVSGNDLYLNNSRNIVTGCYFNGDVTIDGGQDNVIKSFIRGSLTDNGTRTIINGHGTNNGDPSSTGDWNGNAARAHKHGATVWDTSTSPATPYKATPAGSWVAI